MSALDQIQNLWRHAVWADAEMLRALSASPPPEAAVREYAHVLGASEVWLARLEGRAPRAPVWPTPSLREVDGLSRAVRDGYAALLATLAEADLGRGVTYVNSVGQTFTTAIGDILLHVALHGQYHRGKVNLLLRQAELPPAPVDYIGFVRGAPAATQVNLRRAST